MKQSNESKLWTIFCLLGTVVSIYNEFFFASGLLLGFTITMLVISSIAGNDEAMAQLNDAGYHIHNSKLYKLQEDE